jgi:MerC mercury resistance protein
MEKSGNQWKDSLGILASVACAIHCAATPILLAFLPALSFTEWMASPRFHQIAALVCVGMVSLAIWPAFVKFRDYRVLSLSTAGLALLISAAFFLPDECCSRPLGQSAKLASDDHNHAPGEAHVHTAHAGSTYTASLVGPELLSLVQPWMTPLGGLLLVIAHGFNLRRPVRRSSCRNSGCECHRSASTNLASPISLNEPSDRLIASSTTQAA